MARKNPSVLMVLENNPYPFDTRVRFEAEALMDAGYGVTVVCPGEAHEARREVVDGVSVYRFPTPPQGQGVLGYMWEFSYGTLMMTVYTLYLLLRHNFQVVHAYNPPDTVFVLGILAKLFGLKFVFDHRDLSPELYASKFGQRGKLIHRLLLWLERLSCRRADLIIAPNESYRRLEMTRHGVAPDKIAVVRNGPRDGECAPQAVDAELDAQAPIIIGYVGHMSAQDGIDYLLRSLRHLRYDLGRSDFFTVLIGPADDLVALQNLARKLGVADHVRFTGRLPFGPRLLSYLSTADICVEPAPSNPLNDQSTMTKIMEYMALGKPIVAYDLPENRVSADGAALYAHPNDEADFARHIARLMDDPALRERLGQMGQARIREHLGWQYSARQLVQSYATLLHGPRRAVDVSLQTGK